MTSTAWADLALAGLERAFDAHRDPERAAGAAAYMRDQFPFVGLRAADRRRLQNEVMGPLGPPSLEDLLAFAAACWRRDEREYQYAGADVLRRHAALLGPAHLPHLAALITTRSWWDTVDELAAVVGAVVKRTASARAHLDAWLCDHDMWLVRVAILHQLRFREDTDASWLFTACLMHASHRDFFIRKAIGWALRTYAKVAPELVAAFMSEHGGAFAGLTRREAERGIRMGRERGSTSRPH